MKNLFDRVVPKADELTHENFGSTTDLDGTTPSSVLDMLVPFMDGRDLAKGSNDHEDRDYHGDKKDDNNWDDDERRGEEEEEEACEQTLAQLTEINNYILDELEEIGLSMTRTEQEAAQGLVFIGTVLDFADTVTLNIENKTFEAELPAMQLLADQIGFEGELTHEAAESKAKQIKEHIRNLIDRAYEVLRKFLVKSFSENARLKRATAAMLKEFHELKDKRGVGEIEAPLIGNSLDNKKIASLSDIAKELPNLFSGLSTMSLVPFFKDQLKEEEDQRDIFNYHEDLGGNENSNVSRDSEDSDERKYKYASEPGKLYANRVKLATELMKVISKRPGWSRKGDTTTFRSFGIVNTAELTLVSRDSIIASLPATHDSELIYQSVSVSGEGKINVENDTVDDAIKVLTILTKEMDRMLKEQLDNDYVKIAKQTNKASYFTAHEAMQLIIVVSQKDTTACKAIAHGLVNRIARFRKTIK